MEIYCLTSLERVITRIIKFKREEREKIVVGRGSGKIRAAEKRRLTGARFPKESRPAEPTTYVFSVAMPNDSRIYWERFGYLWWHFVGIYRLSKGTQHGCRIAQIS